MHYENRHRLHKLVDTIGSSLWFVMDALWMFGIGPGAMMLILPCIILTIAGFWQPRMNLSKAVVNSAVCCWLLMNIFWMLSDLHILECMVYAKSFFLLGFILILITLINDRNRLAAFKRFRQ